MRTQLLKSLVAVAVASTLAACANNRDRTDDTAYETTGAPAMEAGAASTTAGATLDQGVTDSTQVASTSGTTVDSAGATQVDPTASQAGASTSGQTASSAMTAGQQQQAATASTTTTTTTTTMDSQHQHHHQYQAGQATASTGQVDSGMQASRSAAEMGLTGVASKVEIVDSQMGSSTGGATASSMDSQQMCDMYARLKSANSTEEREAIMTQMMLNLPSPNGSSLVGVREQCAS